VESIVEPMVARLLTALALGLAAAATGRFATRPLALWTAISYLAQLVVDSRYAMRPAPAPGGKGVDQRQSR